MLHCARPPLVLVLNSTENGNLHLESFMLVKGRVFDLLNCSGPFNVTQSPIRVDAACLHNHSSSRPKAFQILVPFTCPSHLNLARSIRSNLRQGVSKSLSGYNVLLRYFVCHFHNLSGGTDFSPALARYVLLNHRGQMVHDARVS
jgi:hypothetical protein